MGSYEREMQLIEEGKAQRGKTALDYFAEIDAELPEEASKLSHRPDYSKTLFAPENDDIYQEFCRFVDMPEPRALEDVENPMNVDGHTAADIYHAMKDHNSRIVRIDGAAVYNMMANLRMKPQIYNRVLDFRPTCYQGGCGAYDAAFNAGYYDD